MTDQNDVPAVILLSDNVVSEAAAPGTSVGEFTVLDEDIGDTHTLMLVDGRRWQYAIYNKRRCSCNSGAVRF